MNLRILSYRVIVFNEGLKNSEEQVVIDFAYSSVVSIKDISAGEELNKENIWVKRPGTGDFLTEDYETILGRKASRFIKKDSQIKKEDLI